MRSKLIVLSKYRLQKAREDLASAKLNLENTLYKASINRSYYAILHSIRAVNALDGFDSKKHSGVISYFNRHSVHTGRFDRRLYSIISSAYRIREKSDYDDFYIASREDAEAQFENAGRFVETVEGFLKPIYDRALLN